jgi:type IV pilus assembly protein PilV
VEATGNKPEGVTMNNTRYPRMNKTNARSPQFGAMLLEVLVSVLLFALGIVALVGLQAKALGTTGDIRDRTEAVNLVNEYVANMWAEGGGNATTNPTGTHASMQTAWQTGSTNCNSFIATRVVPLLGAGSTMTVAFTNRGTPGATAGLGNASMMADVQVTIQWNDRRDTTTHNYSQISPLVWGIQP